MKISFHGIKNTTGVDCRDGYSHMTRHGRIPDELYSTMHIVLTNENGKDLDNFKQILKTFPNRVNPNAMDLTLDEFYTGYSADTAKVYGINEDTVNLNRATLKFFEKIQKFLERVGQMNSKENIIDENFHNESIYAFRRHYDTCADGEYKKLIKDMEANPQCGIDSAEYFARVLKQDIEKFKLEQKHMDEYAKKYFG